MGGGGVIKGHGQVSINFNVFGTQEWHNNGHESLPFGIPPVLSGAPRIVPFRFKRTPTPPPPLYDKEI